MVTISRPGPGGRVDSESVGPAGAMSSQPQPLPRRHWRLGDRGRGRGGRGGGPASGPGPGTARGLRLSASPRIPSHRAMEQLTQP